MLPSMYCEWAHLEADEEEWGAAKLAAERGLVASPLHWDLNYWKGYALHREGRELCRGGDSAKGRELCTQSEVYLTKALDLSPKQPGTSHLRKKIYRALVLNAESFGDEVKVSRYLVDWGRDLPGDATRKGEYLRLREKYPRYLPAI
jgi:hypothetical protein